jgi:hypothetical protein
MNSRPKIKQFFQNLSSNTSLANFQAGRRQRSGEEFLRATAKNASELGPYSRTQNSNARSHDRAKKQHLQS